MAIFPDKNQIPSWPTKMGKRWANGMCQGTDRSIWLYRKVPLGPVDDAVDTNSMLSVPDPLLSAVREMERLARARVTRRAAVKSMFRHVHIMLINVPERYVPDDEQPLKEFLAQQHPRQLVDRRLLLFGVKLKDDLGAHGGWKGRLDSLVSTFSEDGVPMEDFMSDFEQVDRAVKRAGLLVPTQDDFTLADAWWNLGRNSDTPVLPHDDHMHVFSSHGAMSQAWALEEESEPCEDWPKLPGHHKMAMLAFRDLEFQTRAADQPSARWASAIRMQGAAAISIRGQVEPARVTRAELRRNRNRFRSDIREQQAADKMERSEMIEASQMLAQREAEYSAEGAYPTLIDTSVIAAMNGALDGGRFDSAGLTPDSASWSNMLGIQDRALEETMLCSNVRANPLLKDVPIATVAYSGLPSLSVVGDREGALLGFTERDHQPAYISHKAAYVADTLPILLVAGATGSGKTMVLLNLAWQWGQLEPQIPQVIVDPKALALDTRVPTPDGWSTIADLRVGDQVFGRDGQPCQVVAKSPVFTPEQTRLYEFHLSDGQVITADQNHRWVVTTTSDRARIARGEGRTREELVRLRGLVDDLMADVTDADTLSLQGLLDLLRSVGVFRWTTGSHVRTALENRGLVTTSTAKPFMWPARSALKALSLHLAEEASLGTDQLRVLTTDDLLREGLKTVKNGDQSKFALPVAAAVHYPQRELPVSPYLLGVWLGDGTSKSKEITVGGQDKDEMLRIVQAEWKSARATQNKGRDVWTIHCDRDTSRCLYGHQDYVKVNHGERGESLRCNTCEKEYQADYRSGQEHERGEIINGSLHHGLRRAGVIRNKHIPAEYLMSSREQRMALLQGLMDTDGTVKKRGDLRISLCNEVLAKDVLTLVRSLGLKATFWSGPATISEDGVRRVVGTEHVITFRTGEPVFRLPRKAALQPTTTPLRSTMNYIEEIRPVESDEAQCITVDSPDRTYLVEDFVVTHNTGSDHSDIVESAGGRVFSLDELTEADGIFDPLRFAGNAQAGVEVATSMLLQVDPWKEDKKQFESELQVALKYGVDNGATCIGQALLMAQEAELASDALVQPILGLTESSSIFRACVGVDPQGEGLRVANGISLIKVGNTHLDLPQPGKEPETMNQRQAIALVRMMVFGSAMAMTGRNGVLHFDEAWVAMAGGATEMERLGRLARSQTVLPVLYTQRVSDAVNNGLAGYISRGLILHISDKQEAEAACALFNLEPDLRVPRITMPAVTGGSTADIGGTPEWASLRALKDPITGKILRGSVSIYKDLAGRAVPVTVTLPTEFLQLASTNPEDIKRKKLARLEFEEAQERAEAAAMAEQMGSEEHRLMAQKSVPDELEEVIFDPGEDLGLRREQLADSTVQEVEEDDFEDAFSRA